MHAIVAVAAERHEVAMTLPAHSFRFHIAMVTLGIQLAVSTATPAEVFHLLDT